jgi:hypothetical protein
MTGDFAPRKPWKQPMPEIMRRATEPARNADHNTHMRIYRQAVHAWHGEDAEYIGISRNGSPDYLHR